MDKETRKLKLELNQYLKHTMGLKKPSRFRFGKKIHETSMYDDATNIKSIKTESIQDVDDLTKTIDLSKLVDDIQKQDKEAKLYSIDTKDEFVTKKETPRRIIDLIKNDDLSDLTSFECYEEDPSKEKSTKYSMTSKIKDTYDDKDIINYLNDNLNTNKFQKLLFKFIDRTDMLDSDVYANGGIDRRLFSKIRNNENYHPTKETVIQLGIGLKLNLDDLLSLLDSASYSLPMNNYFDLIIRWCFEHKIYNLMTINEFLYDYHCKTLGKED